MVALLVRSLTTAALGAALVLTVAPGASAAESARFDVDDFSYSAWDAQMQLGVDDDGRATLHVTESLTALFPDFDQNRGVVRGIPDRYQGASSEVEVLAVRDEQGADVPFETEIDDGMLFVLTGDDTYQHGLTTYVIEYTMRDVVLAATETKVDEFYWDLLPLDRAQPIDVFAAEITFDETLTDALTGSSSCYFGPEGSSTECAAPGLQGPSVSNGRATFTVSATDLPPRSGLTVAIAMEAGAVAQPPARIPNPTTEWGPLLLGGFSILGAALTRIFASGFRRAQGRATGIIIAQFDVPDSLPPLVAAAIIDKPRAVIPAEIVHQAVRGMLWIHDSEGTPVLQMIPDAAAPDPLDAAAHTALFADADADGYLVMPEENAAFGTRMRAVEEQGKKAAEDRGLLVRKRSTLAAITQGVAIAIAIAGVAVGVWGFSTDRGVAMFSGIAGIVLAIITFAVGGKGLLPMLVHSPEGAQAREYLLGVKEFIRVAEADRIQMLQSYTGAERRSDGTVDTVVLYERLLPYAMLFGQEKEWGKVLEATYQTSGREPSWTSSRHDTFLPALYVMSSQASAAASYQVTPVSTSSSGFGGSSGGGFSGGGGGGGFSGGR